MKKVFLLICLCTVFACNNKGKEPDIQEVSTINLSDDKEPTKQISDVNAEDETLFKVIKLDSLKNFYIIYTKRSGIDYKVVSEKIEIPQGCKKLKKGDLLTLELMSIVGDTSKMSYKVDGVGYQGTEFEFEGDSIRDIYKTKSLVGLCYVE